MTQYSLFGAAAGQPTLDDLDGLVLAGAQWVRGAQGARLSIVVADVWRADALADAFAELGIGDESSATRPIGAARNADSFAVRTRFDQALLARAARWTRGARLRVPDSFALTAGGLRLWAVAAGRRDEPGYLLATAADAPYADAGYRSDPLHTAAGGQLARLGVAGAALTRHAPGQRPGWRITSARRLRRLMELVGPPPAGAGADWPTAVLAADRSPGTGVSTP